MIGAALIPSAVSGQWVYAVRGLVLECPARDSAMVTLTQAEYRERIHGG